MFQGPLSVHPAAAPWYGVDVDIESFQVAAEEIFAGLPEYFIRGIENVAIFVEEEADAETLERMAFDDPDELLGLYQGLPLPDRGSGYGGYPPDMIHLYRRPILAFCRQHGEEVRHCIRHVLIHEIGHYFGFSDAQMHAIERDP
ncbi:MAG TPA: metallopeptidase family protein [Mariprofundaceae bacterium]|nr:metallopeptidase family protein [Mariprofundaceae bacterium]